MFLFILYLHCTLYYNKYKYYLQLFIPSCAWQPRSMRTSLLLRETLSIVEIRGLDHVEIGDHVDDHDVDHLDVDDHGVDEDEDL